MKVRDAKLDGLETACEDYGQAAIYKGTVDGQSGAFLLDGHHLIETGKVFPVCGNTWRMLADTRFAPHFDFIGDFRTLVRLMPRGVSKECTHGKEAIEACPEECREGALWSSGSPQSRKSMKRAQLRRRSRSAACSSS